MWSGRRRSSTHEDPDTSDQLAGRCGDVAACHSRDRANYLTARSVCWPNASVADLYARESVDRQDHRLQPRSLGNRPRPATGKFSLGILLPNSFDSALVFRLAGIPQIVGYDCDIRRLLLTRPVPAPGWKGRVHERFYYLELLQEARLIDGYQASDGPIRLECAAEAAREGRRVFAEQGVALPVIGVSPGAAYGSAKCWLPERFAESAATMASRTERNRSPFRRLP